MEQDVHGLRQRLARYALDAPGAALSFSARLARENGWSAEFARRVCEEYKRFALLALVAPHAVTPSEHVDQAWHLHLLHTEEYWGRFCRDTLARPLHHRPTRGGPAQRAQYAADYRATLASYQRVFGEPAPRDVWPSAALRFGHDLRWVRVNRDDCWIIPRPAWPFGLTRLAGPFLLACCMALAVVGCAGVNLGSALDLPGADFLGLFFWVWVCGASAASFVAFTPGRQRAPGAHQARALDPYDAAYLAGGRKRALEAVLAQLVAERFVRIDTDARRLQALRELPPSVHALQRGVFELARSDASLASLAGASKSELDELERRARAAGLLAGARRYWILAALAAAPLLGALKALVGLARDRPVGYLVLLCAVSTWLALKVFRSCRLSPRGRAQLRALKDRHARLDTRGAPADAGSIAWGVGLFGTTLLLGWGLSEVAAALHAARDTERRASGWSDGAGDGDGGGGCGGGGCGGCGGCGA